MSEQDVDPRTPSPDGHGGQDGQATDLLGLPEARTSARLSLLKLRGFRNLSELSLEPGPRFNVFFGDNGAGKSSLLEAIAYVASLRSFRDAPKDEIIAQDAERADLLARIECQPLSREFRIALPRKQPRKVAIDGKRPQSMGSYYAALQRVMFHPGEAELAAGSPESRRTQLDRILEQVDARYCAATADYQKALRSRNRLLKSPDIDRSSIEAYDAILARQGAHIGRARMTLVEEMAPRVESNFAEITDRALPLEVRYAPRTEPDEATLLRALKESYRKDTARGFTGVGPHGDDLHLRVHETFAKHHASQGQHRAIVLSMKVAELFVLAKRTGTLPLLLLDDVSSELDRSRNQRFFQLLARLGGQVFLTTTHREFIRLDEHRVDWEIEGGRVGRIDGT